MSVLFAQNHQVGIGISLLLCPSEHAPVAIHTAGASIPLLCQARGVRSLSGTRHQWLMLSLCKAGAAGGVCPMVGDTCPVQHLVCGPHDNGGRKCHVDIEAITEMVWYTGHYLGIPYSHLSEPVTCVHCNIVNSHCHCNYQHITQQETVGGTCMNIQANTPFLICSSVQKGRAIFGAYGLFILSCGCATYQVTVYICHCFGFNYLHAAAQTLTLAIYLPLMLKSYIIHLQVCVQYCGKFYTRYISSNIVVSTLSGLVQW